jgi:predicted nucleotidyltransferase
MISQADRDTIIELARDYRASYVILFGSSLDVTREANDIDLGVKGLDPRLFFGFLGELLERLSKPVDLVDLTRRDLFNQLVEKRGVRIYG